jgi:serine/threonine protein kinase/WD40 repeat protein
VQRIGRQLAEDDGPVEAAVAEYLDQVDRCERIDLAKLVAAHPGCESGLRQFLRREQKLQALAWSPTAAHNQAGQVIGDFRLVRELGRGGMGVVYEAVQMSLRRRVAVKVLSRTADSDARSRARFRNETDILAQLRHPHIVDVFVVGEEAGACYYAMEFIDGGDSYLLIDDLARFAADSLDQNGVNSTARGGETSTGLHHGEETEIAPSGSAGIELAAAARCAWHHPEGRCRFIATIARQVADALCHAHDCGVLHRDIKPSNILLDQRGCAFLSDFGLARMRGQETLTELGDVVGTLRYAAPEIVRNTTGRADERSDVYALGASLWEMLAGRRLFEGGERGSLVRRILEEQPEAPSRSRGDVPQDLETIALCALAKEPEWRYQSAELMRDDLDRFLEGRPLSARRTGMTERALLWAMRNRRLAFALAAAIVLLACGATLSAIFIAGARQETMAALAMSQRSEATARKQSDAAAASERAVRRMLYSTDMAMAGAAWKAGEPGRMRLLLDRHAVGAHTSPEFAPFDPRGFEWRFLDRQLRPRSVVLHRSNDALYVLAMAPDGRHFVTAGRESIVRWHNLETGRVTRSIATNQVEINCLSFSPSGRFLVTGGDDGTIKVWRVDGLALRRSVQALKGKIYHSSFLADDDRVVCGGESSTHLVVDVVSGEIAQEFVGPAPPSRPASAAALSLYGSVSRSGKWLLTTRDIKQVSGVDGVDLWDLSTDRRREISSVEEPSCALCDGSGELAFIAGRSELQVVETGSGRLMQSMPLTNRGGPLALSPDGRRLILGAATGEFVVWNVNREPDAAAVLSPSHRMAVHESWVFDAEFTSDGVSVLSVGRDGTVRRTEVEDGPTLFRELDWARDNVLEPIPDSDLVLARKPLAIRDRRSGRVVHRLTDDSPLACAVSSDGSFVAAATASDLQVWNCRKGQLVLDHEGPREKRHISCLSFAGGRSHLVVSDWFLGGTQHRFEGFSLPDGRRTVQLAHNQTRWMFGCEGGGLVFREFDPEGVMCLEIPNGRIRWRRPPFQDHAQVAAISRDGRWLAAGDKERHALMLIDCRTGDVKYRVPCDGQVNTLAVADDGVSFFVGDVNGVVSVWNLELGQKLFDLARFDSQIEYLYPTERSVLAAVTKKVDDRDVRCWYEFDIE